MDDTLQLDIVDLGDAKSVTMGEQIQVFTEDNLELPYRSAD